MSPIPYPSEVVSALREWQEEEAPTAYLVDVASVFGYLVGTVYGDVHSRFIDGHQIATSTVISIGVKFGYLVAYTFSGSRYVIVTHRQEQSTLFENYLRKLTGSNDKTAQ
ncbi:hypothetical protein ACLUTX_29420 [Enterobacterales bacterium AE_CKDN230030158-1A_HGKHYDSX7]